MLNTNRNRICKLSFLEKCLISLIIFVLVYFLLLSKEKFGILWGPSLEQSQKCLIEKIKKVNEEGNFAFEWQRLDEIVRDCTGDLLSTLSIQKLRNLDEFKYVILPKNLESECNTVTLGIGKDVIAEKQLLHKLGHCNFFGVDPDAEDSGQLYQDTVNGTFVQGLVGAKNGTYKATILNGRRYITQNLQHYSFQDLLQKHYKHGFIDYLFMDIEGDEFELMKELINNPNNYPPICQINVEYHNPFSMKNGIKVFGDLEITVINGPFLPLIVESKKRVGFNRIFFVNFKNPFCLNKFF